MPCSPDPRVRISTSSFSYQESPARSDLVSLVRTFGKTGPGARTKSNNDEIQHNPARLRESVSRFRAAKASTMINDAILIHGLIRFCSGRLSNGDIQGRDAETEKRALHHPEVSIRQTFSDPVWRGKNTNGIPQMFICLTIARDQPADQRNYSTKVE